MIKIGILGAAGYTGGELLRLLVHHPEAKIVFANSESNAGNLVADVHGGSVLENPPASAGHAGVIPAMGRSHMLWCPCATTAEPVL